MKAAIYTSYGPPEVVRITDVEKPAPKDDEVLIRVYAAPVNPLDGGSVNGGGRFVNGLRKPKITGLGVDVPGRRKQSADKVTQSKPGDEVFGACIRSPEAPGAKVWVCSGAFAEYMRGFESTFGTRERSNRGRRS